MMLWKKSLLCLYISLYATITIASTPAKVHTSSVNQIDVGKLNHTSNPCRSVVSFVNGIYHSVSELQKIADHLEEIFSEEVRVFYNPSTGNWFSDAYRAGVELIYKPDDLLIAKSLALHLRRALKDVGSDGKLPQNFSHLVRIAEEKKNSVLVFEF
jgi:hypothetical protein